MSHSITVTRTTTTTTSTAIILNTGILRGASGLLKLFETILGGICLGLVAYYQPAKHGFSEGPEQTLFFIVAFAFLVTTFLLLLSSLISLMAASMIPKTVFVCICDVNEPAAKSFLQEVSDESKPNVIFVKCDVSSAEEFRAAFEKTKKTFGKIDVLVNNAGIMNEHDCNRTIEVNFLGPIHGIKLAFEFMGTDSGGAGGFIINTASMAGVYPFAHAPVYCGTKHGVVGLTKSYGQSYYFEKTGITVNAVCPGPIDTSLYRRFPTLTIDEAGAKELISTLTPISPNEVAKAVVQLLQDGKNGSLLRVENDEIKYIE